MRICGLLALLLLCGMGCGRGGSTSSAPAIPNTPTPAPTYPPALRAAPASPSAAASIVSAAASPSPQRKPVSYVAIGASDTVGVGATDPATEGWVPRLARMLGPETRVRNLGVSGTLLS